MELSELVKRSNMLGFSVKVKIAQLLSFMLVLHSGVAIGLGR